MSNFELQTLQYLRCLHLNLVPIVVLIISMDMLYQLDLTYSSLYNYYDIRRIIQLPGISNLLLSNTLL